MAKKAEQEMKGKTRKRKKKEDMPQVNQVKEAPTATIAVAQLLELCPICESTMQGPILLNTWHSEIRAKAIKERDGSILGAAPEPCPDCQSKIRDGYLFFIGVRKEGDRIRKIGPVSMIHQRHIKDWDPSIKSGVIQVYEKDFPEMVKQGIFKESDLPMPLEIDSQESIQSVKIEELEA